MFVKQSVRRSHASNFPNLSNYFVIKPFPTHLYRVDGL